MNWEAISGVGQILGALAVVITLGYVAVQVRYAREATADQNRLERARGVREMALLVAANPELRYDQIKSWGLASYYEQLGSEYHMTPERASGVDWANAYYFWMYWGQYSSTLDKKDLQELENVISALLEIPSMRKTWETSPLVQPVIEPKFVDFVNNIIHPKE